MEQQQIDNVGSEGDSVEKYDIEHDFSLITDRDKEHLPLLICTSKALLTSYLPKSWKGGVLTSAGIISQLSLEQTFTEIPFDQPLQPVPSVNKGLEITMFSGLNKEEVSVMFLIKNKFMTTLLVDVPPWNALDLDILLRNDHLQRAIRRGIHRLVVDDTLFLTNDCSLTASQPLQLNDDRVLSIRSLTQLIGPRFVVTLTPTRLPKSITSLCKEVDLYEIRDLLGKDSINE